MRAYGCGIRQRRPMTWRCNVTCQPRRSLQMRASHACKSTAEARRAPPTPLCACGRPFLRAQSVCGGVFASGTSMFTLQRRHWGRITAAGAGGGTIIRGLYGVHSRWENTAPAVLANPGISWSAKQAPPGVASETGRTGGAHLLEGRDAEAVCETSKSQRFPAPLGTKTSKFRSGAARRRE